MAFSEAFVQWTFKYQFLDGLCSVQPNFPMHPWCLLIPLATTTLNLLRPSWINPWISATALLNGAFDYNKTPLALPGTKVLLHNTPAKRGTWTPYGVNGWFIGAALEHYRCHRIFVSRTHKERIARTVEFPVTPSQCPPLCPLTPPSLSHKTWCTPCKTLNQRRCLPPSNWIKLWR